MDRGELVTLMTAPQAVLDELDRLLERPAWQSDALCRERPELRFVPSSIAEEMVARDAVETCRTCLVRRDCLAFALEDPDLSGIWGGTTTAERRRARKRALSADELLAARAEPDLDDLEHELERDDLTPGARRRIQHRIAWAQRPRKPRASQPAPEWSTPPCTGCAGLLSRKDLERADGLCWACRPAAVGVSA
jgi:WhiB family redox-sensing transcriptional regulator